MIMLKLVERNFNGNTSFPNEMISFDNIRWFLANDAAVRIHRRSREVVVSTHDSFDINPGVRAYPD